MAPYGSYRAADGDLMMGAPTQLAWGKLCAALGSPAELAVDEFATNELRCQHEPELRDALEAMLARKPAAHWLALFEAAGLPCAPIQTVDQVMTDPQVLANDMVVASKGDDGEEVRLVGLPFKLSQTPGSPGAAPPRPGQHNHQVLVDLLGYTDAQIQQLKDEGAL